MVNMEINAMPRILVIHNFPHAYDSMMISQIQQLFVNAVHYNVTIIATYNMSSKNSLSVDAVALIRTVAKCIKCRGVSFEMEDSYGCTSLNGTKHLNIFLDP